MRMLPIHSVCAIILLAGLMGACSPAHAVQRWYVTGSGDDAHDGKTLATAFRTLRKAETVVAPGDTVLIGSGTYTDTDPEAVVTLFVSGTPGAPITWMALPGQHPVIRPSGWQGITITGSYQTLDGLTVIGNNDAITLIDALKDAKAAKPSSHFNTNGITIEGRHSAPDAKPHHTIIRNCTVAKCAGGGIAGLETDYLTVENCQVYENAWYSRYGCSGITMLDNWAHDDAPGYHDIFLHNIVWNNKGLVPWGSIGQLSDGNGILLDVTDQKAQGAANPTANAATVPAAPAPAQPSLSERPEWKAHSLIAYNVSAYNGGSGIHTFRTRFVDIVNNTTYWNGQVVGYAEIFANNSADVNILNNVMVPRPGGQVTSNNRNTDVRWDYNLYPAAQTVLVGPHDIVADPKFVDIDTDPIRGSFHVVKGSRALGTGTNALPQAANIPGFKLPAPGTVNRGAY